jgi:sporulation protein YlmC with PRC-barrel domain
MWWPTWIAQAPRFERNNWETIVSPAWAAQVYQYYGKRPYFEGDAGFQPTADLDRDRISRERISRDQDRSRDQFRRGERTFSQVERADRLIGREVRTSDDERVGRIDDLLVDLESGRLLYAVVSAGGFLRLGERLVAVPPGLFSQVTDRRVIIDANREQLTDAPQYSRDRDRQNDMRSVNFVRNVYRHFGQPMQWDTAGQAARFGNVHSASDLTGMDVQNVQNANIGEISDLMIDMQAGRVLYVILQPDRELARRDSLFALPPNMFTPGTQRDYVVADVDRERLAQAPRFERNNWDTIVSPAWASQVYQYYGKRPYFEGDLQPTGRDDEPNR